MDIIRFLVQNLIVIVVLGVFLEMFLPNSEMRRYVRMVMGLLVIIAVLGALGSLFQSRWKMEFPEALLSHGHPGTVPLSEIMKRGEKLGDKQRGKAIEEYRTGLARQIYALASFSREITLLSVEVDVDDNPNSSKFGQIRQVKLVLKNRNVSFTQEEKRKSESVVEPVTVKVGEKKKTDSRVISEKEPVPAQAQIDAELLVETITNFYNLSPDQVKVVYK